MSACSDSPVMKEMVKDSEFSTSPVEKNTYPEYSSNFPYYGIFTISLMCEFLCNLLIFIPIHAWDLDSYLFS